MTGEVYHLRRRATAADREKALAAHAERRLSFELQVEDGLLNAAQRVAGRAELRRELLEINDHYPRQSMR